MKGIRSDLGKIETILKQLYLTTIIEIKAFLETTGFFKKYIKDFKKIVILLYHIILNKISNC